MSMCGGFLAILARSAAVVSPVLTLERIGVQWMDLSRKKEKIPLKGWYKFLWISLLNARKGDMYNT